ncbi:MAG: AAA family ATPase [Caldilineaceae bacterium]
MPLQKLPIGIQTFAKIRTEDYLYVDKTEQIYRLLTSGKFFFLSRLRRFGKSLTLSTIASIYRGERELFEGLWIAEQWDWQKVHPVLHFSFSGMAIIRWGWRRLWRRNCTVWPHALKSA